MSGQEPETNPRVIVSVVWALVVLILGLTLIVAWALTR